MVQGQINDQKDQLNLERESENSNQLYRSFKSGVDQYTFSTLKKSDFGKSNSVVGAEAFYNLFQEIFCTAHIKPSDLETNPKITEIKGLLMIADDLLNKLESSKVSDKEVLLKMVKHQFNYIICPRISMKSNKQIKRYHCVTCGYDHGLPDELVELIIRIRDKVKTA